jgi:peptidyl-prolyl cis-trans isomerase C
MPSDVDAAEVERNRAGALDDPGGPPTGVGEPWSVEELWLPEEERSIIGGPLSRSGCTPLAGADSAGAYEALLPGVERAAMAALHAPPEDPSKAAPATTHREGPAEVPEAERDLCPAGVPGNASDAEVLAAPTTDRLAMPVVEHFTDPQKNEASALAPGALRPEAGRVPTAEQTTPPSEVNGVSQTRSDVRHSSASGVRRKWLAALALVVIASIVLTSMFLTRSTKLPANAAFRVDGHVTTEAALQRRVQVLGALYGVVPPTDPAQLSDFRRDTAQALVLSIVMRDAARARSVVVADKVVNDAMASIIKQRYPNGGQADFVKALAVQGISEVDVLDELRRQLEVRQLYDQVTKGITVSEAEARKNFLAHPSAYQPRQERHLLELVVTDEVRARELLRRVTSAGSFAALAKMNSLDASTRPGGGDLGTVTADTLDPTFGAAAFAAPAGRAFGPVHTSLGWYLGFVVAVTNPALPVFDSVKDQVREQLASVDQVKAWRAFLQGRLKQGHVEYAAAYRPQHPDALPSAGLTPAPGRASAAP